MQIPKLEKLTLYYGYPSHVNGSNGEVEKALQSFQAYDSIVFGANLELSSHEDHERTHEIISALKSKTHVFGYINLGVTNGHLELNDIYDRIKAWKKMKIFGIFLDSAGLDYGVTRPRQQDVIQHVHESGLNIFINAFKPEDIFHEKCLLTKDDYYLHESFQIQEGEYVDPGFWAAKCEKALQLSKPYGTKHMATTVTSKEIPFNLDQLHYAWWSALLWGFYGFSWGEKWFSSDGSLTFRERPTPNVGKSFISDVSTNGHLYERKTDHGTILVDTETHIGSFTSKSM